MEETFIFGKFLLIEVIDLELILIEFNGTRIDAHHVCYDTWDQKTQHEGTRKLTQSKRDTHVENRISKKEVEWKLCFVNVCIEI